MGGGEGKTFSVAKKIHLVKRFREGEHEKQKKGWSTHTSLESFCGTNTPKLRRNKEWFLKSFGKGERTRCTWQTRSLRIVYGCPDIPFKLVAILERNEDSSC